MPKSSCSWIRACSRPRRVAMRNDPLMPSMKNASRSVLLAFLVALTNAHSLLSQHDYAAPIMAGISNHGQTQGQPYVTAGDRTYLIGTQDGNFPDLGQHVPGEMGGLWLHPIKLIDGFWATVTDI